MNQPPRKQLKLNQCKGVASAGSPQEGTSRGQDDPTAACQGCPMAGPAKEATACRHAEKPRSSFLAAAHEAGLIGAGGMGCDSIPSSDRHGRENGEASGVSDAVNEGGIFSSPPSKEVDELKKSPLSGSRSSSQTLNRVLPSRGS